MKKTMIILICWVCSLAVFAQDTQTSGTSSGTKEMKTIFGQGDGKTKIPLGVFMELNGGYTQFSDKSVFLPGMSLGIMLDHHWTIGVTGNFIGNRDGLRFHNIYYDSTAGKMRGANLDGSYGGLLLEYTLLPQSRVHVVFPLSIGGGNLYYLKRTNNTNYSNHEWYHNQIVSSDHFFYVEPGVKLEFNVLKKLRLGLGVSYRYSPDLKLKNTPSDLINQFTGRISLRFGKF